MIVKLLIFITEKAQVISKVNRCFPTASQAKPSFPTSNPSLIPSGYHRHTAGHWAFTARDVLPPTHKAPSAVFSYMDNKLWKNKGC